MKIRRDYTVEANRLAKAIDTAVVVLKAHPPAQLNDAQLNQVIDWYLATKDKVLRPDEAYKNLRSLDCLIHDVLILFQESTGEAIEAFWQQVLLLGLGYE